MTNETELHEESASAPPGTSRRGLIKRAAILGGAAWVAPTVLHMSVAGAQTEACYAFKIVGNDCSSCEAIDIDQDCQFNPTQPAGCPPGYPPGGGDDQVVLTADGCNASNTFTMTLVSGCTFQFIGVKAGGTCFPICNGNSPSPCGTNTATVNSPNGQNISHVVVGICCAS